MQRIHLNYQLPSLKLFSFKNEYIEITVINKVKILNKFIGFTHNVCKNLNDVAKWEWQQLLCIKIST